MPFYKELANQGIEATDIPVVAFSVGEEELRGIDTKPLVGQLAAWNYFESVDNPVNSKFVTDWKAYAKAKNLPNYQTAVTNDPMEATYVGIHMGPGGREGRHHRRRQGPRSHGRPDLRRTVRLHPDHGQDQPPPAQAGDDRRGPGRRSVLRGLADRRPLRAQPWSPFIPGNDKKPDYAVKN